VPVDPAGPGVVLEHGDIISLGPSQTNTYVYYRAMPLRRRAAVAEWEVAWAAGEPSR